MTDTFCNPPVVAIVGTGNVATHLCNALGDQVTLHRVDPHSFDGMPDHADIVILSVKDNVIDQVAENIPKVFDIIAHTSGSVSIDILSKYGTDYGVFYPLQTFTKDVPLIYAEIPFLIEGNSQKTQETLFRLAKKISGDVRFADSASRKTLHLASVFACNFSNCLIGIADRILRGKDMDYQILLPLLRQTISKLQHVSPIEAQTGPAVRKDFLVINAHIKMLEQSGHDDWAEIYELITNQIISNEL